MSRTQCATAVLSIVLLGILPQHALAQSKMWAIRQLPPSEQSARQSLLDQRVLASGGLGTYWDQAKDQMVVVLPHAGQSSFHSSDIDDLGLDARIETTHANPEDIKSIERMIRQLSLGAQSRDLSLLYYFDASRGRTVIVSNAPRSRFESILALFPDEVAYEEAGIDLQSRHDDGPPHWGGAEINTTEMQCTSGFTVRLGSEAMMLTAKHCGPVRWEIVLGGTGLGWGQVRYQGSITETDLIGNASYNGKIYVNSNTGAAVKGASDPVSWNLYCQSGLISGETCGHRFVGLASEQLGGVWYSSMALFTGGLLTRDGDSGGPWYYRDPNGRVYVAGVHSGKLSDGITMVASIWSRIASDYGVSIVTA